MHNHRALISATTGCAALLAAVIMATSVFAHAAYDSSTPAIGARLTVAPTEVEITFTQEIQKVAGTFDIAVNKDRGSSVTSGPAVVDDADRTTLSVPLQAGLADGRYVVRWKNVSDADGDPKEGAFSFYLNYEPNAVDLSNDEQLAALGAEETPDAVDTATSETPGGASPGSTAPTGGPTASPTEEAADGGDDGGSSSTLWVIIGAVAIGAVAGVGAFAFARSRRG